MDQYKSPAKKLVKFFQESRNKWKIKYLTSIKKIKYFKNRVKFLEESKAKLKTEVNNLKKKVSDLESTLNSKKKL